MSVFVLLIFQSKNVSIELYSLDKKIRVNLKFSKCKNVPRKRRGWPADRVVFAYDRSQGGGARRMDLRGGGRGETS